MQPAQLAFGAGRLRAEGVRLGFNEGGVDLDAEIGGGRVDARVTLRGLPLSLVEAAGADMPLEGRLQGEASLTGTLPRPEGRLRLRTEGLRFAERVAEETPPLDLEVDGRLTAGRLRAEGRLSGFAADSLEVTRSFRCCSPTRRLPSPFLRTSRSRLRRAGPATWRRSSVFCRSTWCGSRGRAISTWP